MATLFLTPSVAFTSTWVGMLLCFIFYGGTFAAALLHTTSRVEVSGRIQGYSALAVDAFITLSLCVILHRSRTGHKATENLISRVIAFVIGRAILIFLVQLLVIVTYKPNGTQAMDGVYCFAGTLNINTALATLNARRPPLNATDIQASGDTSSSPITSFHVRRTSVSTIQSTMTESSESEKFPANVSESLVPEKVDDVIFEGSI
ncbi:hypothetical protein POSPLADRAFT_1061671 [Postia placenta MAD-698-R-SB12]|uniref:DUF6534 domain-containing protein n=1 Tax=Postia placenta MAD-698-R-SB12 TaxID=670580 RepID=A0A1X6MM61_9APHY|nr:hypothetical protein POSPLADRAFT_1061671 [Postia placenta MAD-698-R-SB12]OSX57460.1 hypothetical protein POSPLADRAFT_1061671 [Postia placenta MAD-698-R-SB12]